MISPEERLKAFQSENHITTKGPLSLVVQFTRMVRDKNFPLNPDDFQTSSKGQVAGLGGANLKKILKEHGITQQLSSEGGRTSRGSMGLMIKYVDFLNAWNAEESVDFSVVEEFWAEQVREYFRNQPFVLTADTSKTIGANLDELFEQAKKRQKQNPGTQYLGTVLQHLVAAKLCLIMPENSFEIHGASVADGPTDRNGDFVIGSTVIHCTTMPGALLIEKCKANLRAGCHPVIITIFERVHTALNLAEDAGLAGRVEVWDIQQIHNLLALLHETLPNSNVDDAWIESQVDGHFNLRYTRGEPLEAMKAAAKRILKNYLHDDPELRSKVLHAEKPFEFIIGDAMISGTIDLLNKADPAGENEAKVEIVDFKTGKSGDDLAAAERRSHVQQQLQMYAIATQDALGLEPLKATAHFLYANQPHIKEDVELSEEQMENMKHQIANTVTAIKQGRFPLCASKTRCTSCDFKAICNGSTR